MSLYSGIRKYWEAPVKQHRAEPILRVIIRCDVFDRKALRVGTDHSLAPRQCSNNGVVAGRKWTQPPLHIVCGGGNKTSNSSWLVGKWKPHVWGRGIWYRYLQCFVYILNYSPLQIQYGRFTSSSHPVNNFPSPNTSRGLLWNLIVNIRTGIHLQIAEQF